MYGTLFVPLTPSKVLPWAHNFVLILAEPIDEATADRLFEAGFGDAATTGYDGQPALDVDRKADSKADAIVSARRQAETAGVTVVDVIEDPVTPEG